jgi:Methyltransferase domain
MGFFDDYPAFYESSGIGSQPNRLNARYQALIEGNRDIIEGGRILDIASHDGRWSFAALHAGAEHVVGIEARDGLVTRAREAMDTYGISPSRFDFIVGDVHEVIATLEPNSFSTVFCFGFLYHTLDQMAILSEISRLRPGHLVLDTAVVKSDEPLIVLRHDNPNHEGDAGSKEGRWTRSRPGRYAEPSGTRVDARERRLRLRLRRLDGSAWQRVAIPRGVPGWQASDAPRRAVGLTLPPSGSPAPCSFRVQ